MIFHILSGFESPYFAENGLIYVNLLSAYLRNWK